jgi:hypothetical protein
MRSRSMQRDGIRRVKNIACALPAAPPAALEILSRVVSHAKRDEYVYLTKTYEGISVFQHKASKRYIYLASVNEGSNKKSTLAYRCNAFTHSYQEIDLDLVITNSPPEPDI